MNNVLDYQGFRFFQSSYDQDELGTVLSVNHDFWGTLISYLGYFFMTLGMIVTLFSNKTRFSSIKKNLLKIRNSRGFSILCFVMLSSSVLAESKIDSLLQAQALPYEQAESFGMLVVQDQGGRMKPVNTLASEVLRKVSRQSSFQV